MMPRVRQAIIACVAAIAATGLFAADRPVPPPRGGAPTVEQVFGLRDGSVQVLEARGQVASEVALDLRLAGRPVRLVLRPHSVRSAEFRLLRAGRDGHARELPAPPPRTYRGVVEGVPDSAVAASIVDGQITAWIDMGDGLWGVEPLARRLPGAGAAEHVVYRRSDVVPGEHACGVDAAEELGGGVAGGAAAGGGAACSIAVAQIAIDTDFPFYEQSGGTTESVLADVDAIMNAVDLIYTRDVAIRYQVTAVLLRPTAEDDPYTASSIFQLLGEFRELWNGLYSDPMSPDYIDRDVAHILSGRPNRGVIGVASLGVICDLELAYGVSLSHFTSSFLPRVGLTAHELGHNWRAIHCDADEDCFIMCSSISGCNGDVTRFGSRSIADIAEFRDGRMCLNAGPPVIAPLAKLLAEEDGQLVGDLGDQFGRGLAIEGDVLLVGAWGDDEGEESDVGAVYVYEHGGAGWAAVQRIVPALDDPDDPSDDGAGAFDRFGGSVAMAESLALVGAPTDDGLNDLTRNSGAVYALESGSTWQEVQLIRASDASGSDQFGWSVAIALDGTGTAWAAVGAPFDDAVPVNSGAIYILQRVDGEWQEYQKLIPLDPAPTEEFGTSVAIAYDPVQDRMLVVAGAPGANESDDPLAEDGAVYLFVPESSAPDALFVEDEKLVITTVTGDDDQHFGQSVSIDVDEELGLSIIAGASGADRLAVNAGAAYVYRYDEALGTWDLEGELTRLEAAPGDALGGAVDLRGPTAAVGARLADSSAVNAGSVNLFERTIDDQSGLPVWRPLTTFSPVPALGADLLGTSVVMDDVSPTSGEPVLQIISGAPGDGTQGVAAGAVYAFVIDTSIVDCNGNDFPDECDILGGSSADCNDNGVPDECDIAENPDLDQAPEDGVIDDCQDCNGNGILDLEEIANCGGDPACSDCNGNGVPDECDIASGTSEDLNLDGVPDECAEDCNNNGIPDVLEPDCNGNGIPDDCDIVSGFAADCNGNDVPDSCDIVFGTSTDLDNNGIPDECDPDCNGDGISDFIELFFGFAEDCNENLVPDSCDIADGTSDDVNENRIPDECECPADFDGSGTVDIVDLLGLLSAWGTNDPVFDIAPEMPDGTVDIQDLLALLAAWGDCV